MVTSRRWTIADLEHVTEDGNRYEIIDGELLVSTQPNLEHQLVCGNMYAELRAWNLRTGLGVAVLAPGVIFSEDNAVAPDVVWLTRERYALAAEAEGKLHQAPDIAIEVLSPGVVNTRRDREMKLRLYERQRVQEYWIIDWSSRSLDVYRREGETLSLVQTVSQHDSLDTPLLPGFQVRVGSLFGAGSS